MLHCILVWKRLTIIVSMLGSSDVPIFKGFSNVKKAFLDDTTITKSMQWLNDHARFAMFDPLTHVGIPDNFMFFLATL